MSRRFLAASIALIAAQACGTSPAPGRPDASSQASADAAPSPDAEAAIDPCAIDPDSQACRGDPPPYAGGHPIDRALHRTFWLEGHTPVEASAEELCRRMAVDLLGQSLTQAEVARDCAGKTAEQIADAFLARPEYLLVSERHWRDRLDLDDVNADWRYLKDLFARVDALHQGTLAYQDFVEQIVSHPGFLSRNVQAEDKVRASYRAFLGREASEVEAADLAGMFRPWIPQQEVDPDFPYIYRFGMKILPGLCQPLFRCSSSMLGGGELNLGVMGFDYVAVEDLTPSQVHALQEIGRMFSRQASVYETAADAILERLLGWSDGGRFPREPGILLPEVRQVLAEHLASSGDYRAAEKLVLTSWLYRQRAEVAPDGLPDGAPVPAPYTSGPVKARSAEAWLDSAAAVTIPLGACDPRYADGFTYFLMIQAAQTGTITNAQLALDAARVHALQESRVGFSTLPERDNIRFPDFGFASLARLIGGCPGFQSRRALPEGIAYAYSQESLAELMCQFYAARTRPPGAEPVTVARTVEHQIGLIFGRSAAPEEIAAFEAAYAGCSGAECEEVAMYTAVCAALLGSAEALFY